MLLPKGKLMEEKIPEVNISNDVLEIKDRSSKHFDDKNAAEIVGTLIKKKEFDSFYSLTVLTTAGRNRDLNSFVTVKVPKTISGIEDLQEKTRVHVSGILRNRPVYRNGRENKPEYSAYIQAVEVSEAKSAMEEAFGIKGRSFGNSYNQIVLTGTITRMIQTNRNTARLTILMREHDKKERLVETVFYARNNLRKLLPTLAIGNRICAVAEIQNYRKEPGKSYTVNGKSIVKTTDITTDTAEDPVFVRNVVILDISEV